MALTKVDLDTVEDTLGFDVDHDKSGLFTLNVISGAGTVVVELSADGGTTWNATVFVKTTDTTRAYVATAATTGMWEGTFGGINKIRVRKSVGSASCVVAFGLTEY